MEEGRGNSSEGIDDDPCMLRGSVGIHSAGDRARKETNSSYDDDPDSCQVFTDSDNMKDFDVETCFQESLNAEDVILEDRQESSQRQRFVIKKRCGMEVYVCEDSNQKRGGYEELSADHEEDLKEVVEYIQENCWEPVDHATESIGAAEIDKIKQESSDDTDNQEEFQLLADQDNDGIEDPGDNDDVEYLVDMPELEGDIEKYFCETCQVAFDNLEIAEQHQCNDIEESEDFNCLECSLVFKTSKEFEIHTENEHLAKPETCDYCFEPFTSIRAFYRHKLVDHGIKLPFQCQTCHKIFKSFQALLNHMKRVCHTLKLSPAPAPKIPVTCKICNTKIASEKGLKIHMRAHQVRVPKSIKDALPASAVDEYRELNQFHCEICNKSFDQNLLEIHKKMHQKIVEHACKVCNRQFSNRVLYDMHMQLHAQQTNPQSRFPFRTEDSNGKKLKHLCQYCGRGFGKPYEKVKHERIHTGEKPYKCEVCGKTFRISYSLTMHLRSHTDIRPFHCKVCNKRFKSKPTYAHHLRSHEDVRAYKCNFCAKSFRTSVRLNAHHNSHSKPFSCPVCAKRFASLHATKMHMKTHGKSNTITNRVHKHTCSICGFTSDRSLALLLHMQDDHQIEVHIGESDDEEENGNDNVVNKNEEFRILQEAVSEIYEDIPMNMEEVQLTEEIPHVEENENSLY